MAADYINQLGTLVLDHRFKRLMNRLLAEAACVYRELGVEFKPRWVSTSLLLSNEGPLPVTEIAARLKISHPAVIQVTDGMREAGLVEAEADPQDARRRLVRMTERGLRLMPALARIWQALSQAQEDAFRQAGCDILQVLDAVEGCLGEESICQRVVKRLNRPREAGRLDGKGIEAT